MGIIIYEAGRGKMKASKSWPAIQPYLNRALKIEEDKMSFEKIYVVSGGRRFTIKKFIELRKKRGKK